MDAVNGSSDTESQSYAHANREPVSATAGLPTLSTHDFNRVSHRGREFPASVAVASGGGLRQVGKFGKMFFVESHANRPRQKNPAERTEDGGADASDPSAGLEERAGT